MESINSLQHVINGDNLFQIFACLVMFYGILWLAAPGSNNCKNINPKICVYPVVVVKNPLVRWSIKAMFRTTASTLSTQKPPRIKVVAPGKVKA